MDRRRAYLDALGIERWRCREERAPSRSLDTEVSEVEQPQSGAAGYPPSEPDRSTAAPDPVAVLDWDALRERVRGCTACALHETRTQTVFGVGDPHARLLIVGEAPGADEDRQGEPFVGRAGRLLNLMLEAIGLGREQVFIANILKCRPPGNRDPSSDEALRCEPYLMRQIELIDPDLILSVGRISAQNLLRSDAPVGRLRGQVHRVERCGKPLVVTYHPAYLLRSPEQKAKAWQDLLLARRVLDDAAGRAAG